MKKIFLLFVFLSSFIINSQSKTIELEVLTFEEVEKLQKKAQKPIVVFIYTDWCKFCHGMKKITFKNKKIVKLLNDKFYFIELNAENKKGISFLGRTFVYKPSGANTGTHELAKELATINKRISYPTTTILNQRFEIEIQMSGVKTATEMKNILLKL